MSLLTFITCFTLTSGSWEQGDFELLVEAELNIFNSSGQIVGSTTMSLASELTVLDIYSGDSGLNSRLNSLEISFTDSLLSDGTLFGLAATDFVQTGEEFDGYGEGFNIIYGGSPNQDYEIVWYDDGWSFEIYSYPDEVGGSDDLWFYTSIYSDAFGELYSLQVSDLISMQYVAVPSPSILASLVIPVLRKRKRSS